MWCLNGTNLFLSMKKLKLIILLFFSLFIQQLHGLPNCREHNFSAQNFEENDLSFETNGDYIYLTGILPCAQVFFNIVPVAPVSFSFNAKTNNPNSGLFTSGTKIIFNPSFHQVSCFSRYSSNFIQIYLRAACFRL